MESVCYNDHFELFSYFPMLDAVLHTPNLFFFLCLLLKEKKKVRTGEFRLEGWIIISIDVRWLLRGMIRLPAGIIIHKT